MENRVYRIFIVDQDDNPIGYKTYGRLKYEDIYRVAALWLTDEKTGMVLIAQRKWNKINDPGKWSSAAAGTVEEGETYEENIAKETEEELGIKDIQLTKGPKNYVDDKAHRFFVQWFFGKVDKDTTKIAIQEDEVEDYRWISKADLISELKTNPDKFTPSTEESLRVLGVME